MSDCPLCDPPASDQKHRHQPECPVRLTLEGRSTKYWLKCVVRAARSGDETAEEIADDFLSWGLV